MKNIAIFLTCLSLLSIFLHLYTSEAKADTFYPLGNISDCNFASTIGVQYRNINTNLKYDSAKVKGVKSGWIESHNMLDVADIAYPNARRYPGVADHVAVPPHTKVDVGMFSWNYSGHTVNIKQQHLFLSHNDPSKGDLTKLGAGGTKNTTTFDNGRYSRTGMRNILAGIGEVPNRQAVNGKVIYTFETIQPIELLKRTVVKEFVDGDLVLKFSNQVINRSRYGVCDVDLIDKLPDNSTFQTKLCLNAGQIKTVNYQINMGKTYPNRIVDDGITIKDNNTYTESTGSHYGSTNDYYNFDARSLYVLRDDQGHPEWGGIQPGWGQIDRDLISVEIIPYEFTSGGSEIEVLPDVTIEKNVSTIVADPGEILDYELIIRNNGGTAQNLMLVDQLDLEKVEIVENSNASISEGKLIWILDKIVNSEEITLNFKVKVKNFGEPGNTYHIDNTVHLIYAGLDEPKQSNTTETRISIPLPPPPPPVKAPKEDILLPASVLPTSYPPGSTLSKTGSPMYDAYLIMGGSALPIFLLTIKFLKKRKIV